MQNTRRTGSVAFTVFGSLPWGVVTGRLLQSERRFSSDANGGTARVGVVLDVSDVPRSEHYRSLGFIPAVEREVVPPGSSFDRKPVTDGGLPSSAGISPVDASMLSSFLDDHADAPGFELTYTEDGTERTQLCHSVSLHAVSLERPSAAPALQCTPLSPGGDRFIVAIDTIEILSVVQPPPELYTADAETPSEEATGLRRLADVNPDAVRISSLLAILDREDGDLFRDQEVLKALSRVSAVRPEDCTPAIPILRSLLAEEELLGRAELLATLRAIGESDPGAIAPLTEELMPYLESNVVSVRREATRCLSAIADEHPDDVVQAVQTLAAVVEDGATGLPYAVYALSRITREYPEAVKSVAETLGEVTLDDSLSDGVRLNATAGLGRIVGEYPDVAVEIVDDVAALFDVENPKLRNNAMGIIGDVAIIHTDVVEPYTEEITPLLTVDDSYTRINASGALSRVAEDFPESVDHVTSTFIELLSDENPLVRENACWALGRLRAREATSVLEDHAQSDEDADVRLRASWALTQINE